MEFRPVPKPTHKRRKPKRGQEGKFSPKTIQTILERDEYACVRCGSFYVESVPHHIIYRSQLGKGTEDNGCTICRECHDWAHNFKEGRLWFELWRERNLINNKHEK